MDEWTLTLLAGALLGGLVVALVGGLTEQGRRIAQCEDCEILDARVRECEEMAEGLGLDRAEGPDA